MITSFLFAYWWRSRGAPFTTHGKDEMIRILSLLSQWYTAEKGTPAIVIINQFFSP